MDLIDNTGKDSSLQKQILEFERIYTEYVDDLYHYGQRITSDKDIIKDCIQDLFVHLWEQRGQLDHIRSIKFYLYKALKRNIIRKLVRLSKLPINKNILEEHTFEITISYQSELIIKQESSQQTQQLLESINKLPRRQKEAITLKFLDGMTYKEVAALMSMSVRSTYNLIYRALANLKLSLSTIVLAILVSMVVW